MEELSDRLGEDFVFRCIDTWKIMDARLPSRGGLEKRDIYLGHCSSMGFTRVLVSVNHDTPGLQFWNARWFLVYIAICLVNICVLHLRKHLLVWMILVLYQQR